MVLSMNFVGNKVVLKCQKVGHPWGNGAGGAGETKSECLLGETRQSFCDQVEVKAQDKKQSEESDSWTTEREGRREEGEGRGKGEG